MLQEQSFPVIISDYLQKLSPSETKAVSDFCSFMQSKFPRLQPRISFSMPMWLVGSKMSEGYVAISTAKNHFSIHFSSEEVVAQILQATAHCKAGKRCVNIPYDDLIDYELVKKFVVQHLTKAMTSQELSGGNDQDKTATIIVRKATNKDIDRIAAIYSSIHDEEESGRVAIGWKRSIYPVRKTAEDAVLRGDMFVMEDEGRVIATGIINQRQVPEYVNCKWEFPAPDDEVMVLHTLVVDPKTKGRGYGTAFVRFYEQYAIDNNCHYLRMDTNKINLSARRLYARLGYKEPGIVPCVFNGIPGVQLVCLEKKV